MIDRYSRPKMRFIWSDEHRLQLWQEVERVVCEELHVAGVIPSGAWKRLSQAFDRLKKRGGLSPQKVSEWEKVTRHETLAFTTALAEELGPEARYVHFGLTSSDILDTALALQLQAAGRLIQEELAGLISILERRAWEFRALPTIGRSHGIWAEPTSFGLKFLSWASEFRRAQTRIHAALDAVAFGKLSGAVGVNAHWNPEFEKRALGRLGLKREWVSTQIIPRDRHAEWVSALALLGASIERMATELRHLQRSEVDEVREGFHSGQKGSSAMPHKRNPISSENLTGCARLLRSGIHAALENVTLWHERDMSHSSVERVILPDLAIIADYALNRAAGVISNLEVREETVRRNLEAPGSIVFSGHVLLALVRKGVSREEGYRWIQAASHQALDSDGDFVEELLRNPSVSKLFSARELQKLCSLEHQLKSVERIFALYRKEHRLPKGVWGGAES
jgi:adenylosuccinate lyase